jgi:hypothetical protein
VVLADAATHRGLTSVDRLRSHVNRSTGRNGIATMRWVVDMTEPKTGSPMETRLRMLLALGGIRRPVVQPSLHDRNGNFLARPDLYFPDAKLAVEYDGSVHKTSLVEDSRRQNRMLAEGIRILRFTASDVYSRPRVVVDHVRTMLNRAA